MMDEHPGNSIAKVMIVTSKQDEVVPHVVNRFTGGEGAFGYGRQIEEAFQILEDICSPLSSPSIFVHHAVKERLELVCHDRSFAIELEYEFVSATCCSELAGLCTAVRAAKSPFGFNCRVHGIDSE
jgi:hypothetical protein